MKEINAPWASLIPENDFVSCSPTYKVGEYFNLFHEDRFCGPGEEQYSKLKYYYYNPTENGFEKSSGYPLLIFLHGTSNSLNGNICINYTGAELFASPKYQADFRGAYILVPVANEYRDENGTRGSWCKEYTESLFALIQEFIRKHTNGIVKKFFVR